MKNLGVIWERSLSMEGQVNSICKKAFYHLHNILRMRKYLDTDATKTLVATLVTSQLDYCNGLLIGLSKATVKKLQRVQNTAARIIARQGKYDHISPVLRDLHWLPVDQRIEFKVLVLAFKALHGLAPHYLQELLQPYNPKRELRSSHRGMLAEPTYRRERFGGRSFSSVAPRLWNSLPQHLRDTDSLLYFKRNLKTFLFRNIYVS